MAKKPTPKTKNEAPTPSRKKRVAKWALKWSARIIGIALALLLALIVLYAIPGVKPLSILMLGDGLSGKGFQREWIALEDMSTYAHRAVIVAEDARFCDHHGVDWNAVEHAARDAVDGKRLRGASTITMQVVKNLFLWSDRSFIRKGIEMPIALATDSLWGKRRVLELYLNIAEWGDGVYGVQAAAKHYFGTNASQLSLAQASALAASLPNPLARNPASPSAYMHSRISTISARSRVSGGLLRCVE